MLTCQHCGMIHSATCPRIKAIEYYPDGTTKSIEFHDIVSRPQSEDASRKKGE